MRNIKQNLFGLFHNSVGIPIAAGILYAWRPRLNPMIAAGAMSFSSVSVLLNALRLKSFAPKYKSLSPKEEYDMKKILWIEGMSCQHCVKHVQQALEKVEGIQVIEVNLKKKYAMVNLEKEVEDKILSTVIKEAGYELKKVENDAKKKKTVLNLFKTVKSNGWYYTDDRRRSMCIDISIKYQYKLLEKVIF